MNLRMTTNALLCAGLLALAGCDMLADKAAVEMLKASLKTVCGDDDKACIAAVDSQFDACHEKYSADWKAFVDAEGEDEALLDAYNQKITNCIVDENGAPYFDTDEDEGSATDADNNNPVEPAEPGDGTADADADAEDKRKD